MGMVSIARGITAILGFFATYFLYEAYNTLTQEDYTTFEDLLGALIGSAFILFLHLALIVIALPFLLYSIFGMDKIPKLYALIISVESILNATFLWLLVNPLDSGDPNSLIIIFLELIPVFLILLRKSKLS